MKTGVSVTNRATEPPIREFFKHSKQDWSTKDGRDQSVRYLQNVFSAFICIRWTLFSQNMSLVDSQWRNANQKWWTIILLIQCKLEFWLVLCQNQHCEPYIHSPLYNNPNYITLTLFSDPMLSLLFGVWPPELLGFTWSARVATNQDTASLGPLNFLSCQYCPSAEPSVPLCAPLL